MFICEEGMHCVDCPRNDATEYCCHWIEVEPVRHGKWIKTSTCKDRNYQCSVCGNILDFSGVNAGRGDANYCPNCGAEMDKVKQYDL